MRIDARETGTEPDRDPVPAYAVDTIQDHEATPDAVSVYEVASRHHPAGVSVAIYVCIYTIRRTGALIFKTTRRNRELSAAARNEIAACVHLSVYASIPAKANNEKRDGSAAQRLGTHRITRATLERPLLGG